MDDIDNFGMPLFEMANVRKSFTGLPVNIWIQQKSEGTRKGLRVKVSNLYSNSMDHEKTFYIYFDGDQMKIGGDTGEIRSRDIDLVKNFVETNLGILKMHWNKEIDDDEAKVSFRRV